MKTNKPKTVENHSTHNKTMSLNNILQKTRIYNGHFNFVSIDPTGKYHFTSEDLQLFFDIYDYKQNICLGEMPQIYSMLRFDFDIQYNINDYYKDYDITENNKLYSIDDVKFIINELNKVIKKRISDISDNDLTCCLFEKDIYEIPEKKIVKGGFHLQYPKLFLQNSVMENLPKEIEVIVYDETAIKFDLGIYGKKPWLLYGCAKNKNLKPYLLTKIYNVSLIEMTVLDTFINYSLFDQNEKQIEITHDNVDCLLPQIFSINPNNRKTQDCNAFVFEKPNTKPIKEKIINRDVEKDLLECRKLLPLINSSRFDNFDKWMELGWIMYSIGQGSSEALDIWNEKSQLSDKYQIGCCEIKWDTMHVGNFTTATLHMMAKEDNLVEYNKLFTKKIEEKENFCPTSDEDIGIFLISEIEKNGNIFYSKKRKCIFVYNEKSRLFEEKEIDILMTYISFYMTPLINKNIDDLLEQINIKENEKLILDKDLDSKRLKLIDLDIKNLKNKEKPYVKLLNDVKSTTFQTKVLKQMTLRIKNSDDYIESTFNKIKNLLAIADNKVIDLKTLNIMDRSKEHCFTYTTNNNFKKERPNKDWVYNYISQILKTENEKFVQCFLTWFGYCLTGETCVKSFPILTGDGDNGKTAFFNVIKEIFGKFAVVGNEKVFLINDKSNSVHSDEYLPLIGKRFSYIQEINKKSKFNEKLIKTITGNDGDISVRGCGGRTMEVIIDCKLLCICNGDDIPDFEDKQGFSNRVMVFPFKNKFERDAKKLDEINSMKDDIFTELCYYVKDFFYNNNMIINFSDEIISATDELKDNKDSIKMFFNEKLEITSNSKDRIKKDVLFSSYIDYCQENDFKNIKAGKQEFYKTLTNKFSLSIYRDREFENVKFVKNDFDKLSFHNPL